MFLLERPRTVCVYPGPIPASLTVSAYKVLVLTQPWPCENHCKSLVGALPLELIWDPRRLYKHQALVFIPYPAICFWLFSWTLALIWKLNSSSVSLLKLGP